MTLSFKVAVLFCFLGSNKLEFLVAPHSHWHFGIVSVLCSGHSNRSMMDPIALICNFLIAYDAAHHFMCLFAICILALVRYLFRPFAHFLDWVVHFLISEF